MMGKIYAHAQAVIVWLGPSDDDTQAAIELMNIISDRCRQFVHPEGIGRSAWEDELSHADHFLDYLPDRDDHAASTSRDPRSIFLDRLFSRPWFRRTWVIQEVATCKDVQVMCGNYHFAWDLVALAASWCLWGPESYNLQERFKNVDSISNANFMRDKVWQTAETVTFLYLLGKGRDSWQLTPEIRYTPC
jgi:hypothetical protein